jgi:hypothetical protein
MNRDTQVSTWLDECEFYYLFMFIS